MIGHAGLKGSALHEAAEYVAATAEIDKFRLEQGSFSLRRAHYFSDIWHEKIIAHNLRLALVDTIAMLYVSRGMPLPELIKEGNIGLNHALENFELEGGSHFSTYAVRCIRQSIERAILKHAPATGNKPARGAAAPGSSGQRPASDSVLT